MDRTPELIYTDIVALELRRLGLAELVEMVIAEGRFTENEFAIVLSQQILSSFFYRIPSDRCAKIIYEAFSEAYQKVVKQETKGVVQ